MSNHVANDAELQDSAAAIVRLIGIMRRLRDPDTGCPWDIEQDFASILPYTIEEAYEVADAIERREWDELEGELGDLLLQTVYHAQMGSEAGLFDFGSIANRVSQKMVDRHPHVFGPDAVERTASEQEVSWEDSKAQERLGRKEVGVLDGVAKALPALTRAAKLQRRAATVGFDWPATEGVVGKIREELDELEAAIESLDSGSISEEFGDILFTCVNLARHLGLDPEAELRAANRKFTRRFEALEEAIRSEGLEFAELELAELDEFWERSKASS